MKKLYALRSFLAVQFHLVLIVVIVKRQGDASFICDTALYHPLCPGTRVQCSCVVDGSYSTTRWIFTSFSGLQFCLYNFIELLQPPPCLPPMIGSVGSCGGYLTAANRDPGQGLPCSTSTLTVSAHTVLNGLRIECRDMSQEEFGILIGNSSIIIVGPPGDPTITAVAVTTEDMAVTWITPSADGNPTSYNISITNRSDPVKVNHTGPSEYTHIFRGLRSDTMYTVLLVAINCAGVSNTTEIFQRTLAEPPARDSIMAVYISNHSVSMIYISWKPVGGSVTTYRLRIAGNGNSIGQHSVYCTIECFYIQIQNPAFYLTNYTVYLASINGYGDIGPENNVTISDFGTSVETTAVTGTIEKMFHTTYYLYPTSPVISNKASDWFNDYRILAVLIATAVLTTCGVIVICAGVTCRYCKQKPKKSLQLQFQNTIALSDVIYEDLSRGKCNPDAHGVVTMTNIAYAARSDMAYNVQQS